jgi:hypothetical protein
VLDVATTDSSSGTFGLPGVGDGNLASPLPFSATGANRVTAGNFNADPLPDLAMADFRVEHCTRRHGAPQHHAGPSPARVDSVAAGGSCTPDGRQGTIAVALADVGDSAGAVTLSLTSSNPALVPTSAATL